MLLVMPVCVAKASLQLKDVLHATLEKQGVTETSVEQQTSSTALKWLDGAPSLSVMYLHNQTALGSKEAEISLSLPIKSQLMREVEQNLGSYHEVIENTAKSQLALYYSGLIRDLVWTYKSEYLLSEIEQSKAKKLEQLLAQYTQMAKLNALPQYTLLLLKKELNDSRILQLKRNRNASKVLQQYKNITGLNDMPVNIEEIMPRNSNAHILQHPRVLALDAKWNVAQENLKGSGKSAQAWNLQLSAKRIDTNGMSENQVGIGVDIPLALGQPLSNSRQFEFQQAQLEYNVERNTLLLDIKTQSDAAIAEHDFLLQKQALLNEGAANIETLQTSITALIDANSPNQDIHIRNLIAVIDAKGDISRNQLNIQRQVANTRQILGLTL